MTNCFYLVFIQKFSFYFELTYIYIYVFVGNRYWLEKRDLSYMTMFNQFPRYISVKWWFCDGSSKSSRRGDFIWTEIRRKKWTELKITLLKIYIEKKCFLHQLFFFFLLILFYRENGCKSYRFLNAHFRRRFLMLSRLFVKSRGLVINTLHYIAMNSVYVTLWFIVDWRK